MKCYLFSLPFDRLTGAGSKVLADFGASIFALCANIEAL
jgi:hypothetical protein